MGEFGYCRVFTTFQSLKCSKMETMDPSLTSQLSHEEKYDDDDSANSEPEAISTKPKSRRQKQQQQPSISKSKQKKLLRQEQSKQHKLKVLDAFHDFYRAQYSDRWSTLLSALEAKPRSACLINKYADPKAVDYNISGINNVQTVPFVSVPLLECPDRFPHPERDDRNIYTCYLLDAASVLVTEALDISPQDRVLDLCAAPGGKSVAILQRLRLPFGSLTANEMSTDRRRRLWKVIMDYVPEDLRSHVMVTGRDGTQWIQSELFDKVLVDAPCSSERHLLQNHEELYSWTENRTVQCAKRQLALLNAALKSAIIGGLVVYSTCSISNAENDKVIEKALKKSRVAFEVVRRSWLIGERTGYGWVVLPDTEGGWGPIYFSILRRVS